MATKTVLASDGMTDGQIEDLTNKFRDAARKHRDEIEKGPAQEALRSDNIGMHLFAVFRKLVEEVSRRVVHLVRVDRSCTPQTALDATGRKQYADKSIVAAMPRGQGDEVRLVYFKPGPECYENGVMSCATLAVEYERHGLVPDPMAQVADNAADPVFADEHPNACQWQDKDGKWCYVAFIRWRDGRDVSVSRHGSGWHGAWVFAGVCK